MLTYVDAGAPPPAKIDIVTKPPNVTKLKGGGRPPIGTTAMTPAERQAKRRRQGEGARR